MKQMLKKIVPKRLRMRFRSLQITLKNSIAGLRSPEAVFTRIYESNGWGGAAGDFNSGSGTSCETITDEYFKVVSDYLHGHDLHGKRYVDLGCGDFRVGRRFLPLASGYTGVDVVPGLISKLQSEYGDDKTQFLKLDLVRDNLPDGDVCFIRQVMQHMSNAQILKFLPKLERYDIVVITEHYPVEADRSSYNLDKPCGSTIRLEGGSGVYLEQLPFNLPASQLQTLLEVPGAYCGRTGVGVMRTFVYAPKPSGEKL